MAITFKGCCFWPPWTAEMKMLAASERGVIVAPPRTGKTMLLQSLANSMTTNHPDIVLIVLFLGAISFDLWSGFSTRRSYAGAADQAAQAGANALDESLFRSTGERRLDPARAEALAESIGTEASGKKFLLLRASRGREVLSERLTQKGGHVEQIVVYNSIDINARLVGVYQHHPVISQIRYNF